MPQFGEPNLRHLPDLLSRLDSLKRVDFLLPKPESNNPKEQSREKEMRAGWRELVGDRALNCIACHSFDGQASNQRGIDLMVMTQRLQPGWYYQYMINPSAFRPRTVMPTSWPDGKGVFTTSDRCVPVTKMGCCTEMRITGQRNPGREIDGASILSPIPLDLTVHSHFTTLSRIRLSVLASSHFAEISAAEASPAKHPVPDNPLWVTFPANAGPAAPKHIVLIAAGQEYRSEIALPMLAKIRAGRHGFHGTVLISLNDKDKVDPTKKVRYDDKNAIRKVPGLEHLDQADLVILFSRLISLPAADLKQVRKYFHSGKPIIGIRTANHGILDLDCKVNDKRVGLGDGVFGGAFRSHHGRWQQDSTRGIIVEKNKNHSILRGVRDIWEPTDVIGLSKRGVASPQGARHWSMGNP